MAIISGGGGNDRGVIRIPIVGMAKDMSGQVVPNCDVEYTEVYMDYNTMTYRTRHQDRQIQELRDQKEKSEKTKKQKLKQLIAYYYRK